MDNRKLQQILVWVLVIIGLGAVVLGMVGVVSQKSQKAASGVLINSVSSNDWVRGGKNAKVTLVEYSDFECPACGYYYGMVKQLEKDFPGDLEVVYRNFPLPQHKYGKLAAQAAEAAGKQGKFWEMHDMLFEKQNEWSVSNDALQNFAVYAQSLNLNIDKFKADMNSSEISDKIQASIDDGNKQGLQGTPTFFLDGKQITNPASYNDFKALVEKESAK